jgi:hypothetical protein
MECSKHLCHETRYGSLRTKVDEDIITDQNIETKAWQERVELKRSVLSRPWKLPPSSLAQYHTAKRSNSSAESAINPVQHTDKMAHKSTTQKLDFTTLPPYAHSIRNLKLLLLSHIKTLQRFTLRELLSTDHLHYAATCVVRHEQPEGFTDRDVQNTLLAAITLLLGDGNLIHPHPNGTSEEDDVYVVVGSWNLASTIKSIAKRDGKVIARDVWKKVVSWGNGWEGTTKGVIGTVIEEVLLALHGQEWVENKSGVWTKLDV